MLADRDDSRCFAFALLRPAVLRQPFCVMLFLRLTLTLALHRQAALEHRLTA